MIRNTSRQAAEPHATLPVFFMVASLFLSLPLVAGEPPNQPTLGASVTILLENTGEYPFADAFKASLPWQSGELMGCFDCGPPLDLDANGWVRTLDDTQPNGGQVAVTLVFNDLSGEYPSGTYNVLYSGSGTLEYEGSASLVSRSPGRDVVDVDASSPDPFVMTLIETDPMSNGDYLRDIRIAMPGGVCSNAPLTACASAADCPMAASCNLFVNHPNQRFHPQFLRNLEPFSVIRVKDWMETDEVDFVDFVDYPELDDARWPSVPPEVMAELANVLDVDLWINVPHLATDAFVTTFANQLYTHLESERRLYVAYSNEVWNTVFRQHLPVAVLGCQAYADLQAGCDADDVPMNGTYCEGHPTNFNNSCVEAQRRWTSERSVASWDIFTGIFGINRIVRVMSSQLGQTDMHDDLLSWQNAHLKTDALATATYFGLALGADPMVAGWNLNQLFEAITDSEIPTTLSEMQNDVDFLANNYPNIPLIQYEGGQDLTASTALQSNTNMRTLFDNANRDDRMADAYLQLLRGWKAQGGRLFMHFQNVRRFTEFGRYGALEYQDQPHASAPKYRTLVAFNDEVFVDGFETGDLAFWSSSVP